MKVSCKGEERKKERRDPKTHIVAQFTNEGGVRKDPPSPLFNSHGLFAHTIRETGVTSACRFMQRAEKEQRCEEIEDEAT